MAQVYSAENENGNVKEIGRNEGPRTRLSRNLRPGMVEGVMRELVAVGVVPMFCVVGTGRVPK